MLYSGAYKVLYVVHAYTASDNVKKWSKLEIPPCSTKAAVTNRVSKPRPSGRLTSLFLPTWAPCPLPGRRRVGPRQRAPLGPLGQRGQSATFSPLLLSPFHSSPPPTSHSLHILSPSFQLQFF